MYIYVAINHNLKDKEKETEESKESNLTNGLSLRENLRAYQESFKFVIFYFIWITEAAWHSFI